MQRLHAHPIGPAWALAVAFVLIACRGSDAAPSYGVGADYYAGPRGQTTNDVLGFLSTSWRGNDLTFAAARYEHSVLGPGASGSIVANVPAISKASLQIIGARILGSDGYRAWRIQAGPVIGIGAGRTIGISYVRAEDTQSPNTSGFSTELGLSLSQSLAVLARGSLASVQGGGTNLQGTAGVTWSPMNRILFLAELGVGRDVVGFSQAQSGVGLVGNPTQPATAPDYVSGAALLIGMRFLVH